MQQRLNQRSTDGIMQYRVLHHLNIPPTPKCDMQHCRISLNNTNPNPTSAVHWTEQGKTTESVHCTICLLYTSDAADE